jgi:hypothetical protein
MSYGLKGGIAVGVVLVGLGLLGLQKYTHDRAQAKADRQPPAAAQPHLPQPPTRAYQQVTIQGFTVLIDPQISHDPATTQTLIAQFDATLQDIGRFVQPPQLAALRQTKIWLSPAALKIGGQPGAPAVQGNSDTAAVYRSGSRTVLHGNGENPDKAKSIEIGNIRLFSQYPAEIRFTIVLHELAHAYHDQVLGAGNPEILAAYQQAMAQKLYQLADYRQGHQTNAYAETNFQEYFAELSAAYLAWNNGFPQRRADIEKLDPVGYRLMQKIWGDAGGAVNPGVTVNPEGTNP